MIRKTPKFTVNLPLGNVLTEINCVCILQKEFFGSASGLFNRDTSCSGHTTISVFYTTDVESLVIWFHELAHAVDYYLNFQAERNQLYLREPVACRICLWLCKLYGIKPDRYWIESYAQCYEGYNGRTIQEEKIIYKRCLKIKKYLSRFLDCASSKNVTLVKPQLTFIEINNPEDIEKYIVGFNSIDVASVV